MALVHYDQAELWQRCEQGAARSDDYAQIAGARPSPGVVALTRRQARVNQPYLSWKARHHEAPDGLRGECNLGHQNDSLFAHAQCCFDRPQVDLCLTGTGDAVQ